MERLANIVMDLVGKSYLNFDDNVKLLEADLQILASRAIDIENEVTIAEGSGRKKRKREIEHWFENVKQVKDNFTAVQNREKEQGFLRYPLRGNRVAELQQQVAALLEQSQHFNELVLDATENRVGVPRITSKLFGNVFKKNFEKILQCLLIDNVSMVGVYGMGGVGKTALVEHIHNHLFESTNCRVHWFTISQEYSMKRLQNQIAKAIHLDLSDEEDEKIRAVMLSSGLMKIKNLVIILDDVWEWFCLQSVGVPLGKNGCKVILTTRSSKLCDQMDCQRKFEVNTLHRDDAWELFKYTVGSRIILQEEIGKIAKTIAERCGGLPLGIITMAGSMKGVEDIHDWRDALEQLKSYSMANSEMDEKVFAVLGWSFNRLKSKYQKNCLLYCSLHAEYHSIDRWRLIQEFISAGLLEGRETRKQEFDQGHRILTELVKVCLLEETNNGRYVKMHDLIRDMALRITSGESMPMILGDKPRFLVKAGMRLIEVPEQNQWAEDLDTVSLMDNPKLDVSPDMSPNCPNLSILILRCTAFSAIPNSFFRHMIISLRVLDLSHTWIKELPSCVSNMENLSALLLRDCRLLEYVPPLGKLKKLRELDIRSTRIKDAPQGLEMLESLRCLYMTNCCEVPKGTLLRLHRLQCLQIGYVDIGEVEILKHLEELCLKLNSLDACNQLSKTLHRINSYDIIVNEIRYLEISDIQWIYPMMERKRLVLENCSIGNKGEANVVLLPEDIQELEIESCFATGKCLSDLLPQLSILNGLVHCSVEDSFEEVEFLLRFSSISSSHEQQKPSGCTPLHNLVKLKLSHFPNLLGFIGWEPEGTSRCLPSGTFSNLKDLSISQCHKIRKLLVPSLLQNLQNLKVAYVGSCHNLEEIIGEDEVRGLELTSSRTSTAILPKLRKITLHDLPELKSICGGEMTCDSISRIRVEYCPKLRRLPLSFPTANGQISCPRNLKKIEGSEEWWESLEWDNPSAKSAIQPKFHPLIQFYRRKFSPIHMSS